MAESTWVGLDVHARKVVAHCNHRAKVGESLVTQRGRTDHALRQAPRMGARSSVTAFRSHIDANSCSNRYPGRESATGSRQLPGLVSRKCVSRSPPSRHVGFLNPSRSSIDRPPATLSVMCKRLHGARRADVRATEQHST